MILFDFKCEQGHVTEQLVANSTKVMAPCGDCGRSAHKVFSPAIGRALFFEEGRTRTIANLETLGPGNISSGPVRISSRQQHIDAMKRAGVEPAGWSKNGNVGQTGRWI